MTTWKQLITRKMAEYGERPGDTMHVALRQSDASVRRGETFDTNLLDICFDNRSSVPEGHYFTVWTRNRVYFPVVYNGEETVGSVPRNPCKEATKHIGDW